MGTNTFKQNAGINEEKPMQYSRLATPLRPNGRKERAQELLNLGAGQQNDRD
jgi:hypothetical protein